MSEISLKLLFKMQKNAIFDNVIEMQVCKKYPIFIDRSYKKVFDIAG